MYININKVWNLQDYYIGYVQQYVEVVIYSTIGFFLPFLVGHPQIVVGVIVNSLLILSALNLQKYKLLPLVIMPSLGALSRGILFGPFTLYLLYFIPFIWIGNSILVFAFKHFNLKEKRNYFVTLFAGSFLKAAFLFSIAYLFVSIKLVPVVFLTAMGVMQLTTALMGGVVAYGTQRIKKQFNY